MIHKDTIKVDEVLGQGEFGEVCKGIWTDPSGGEVGFTFVKSIHNNSKFGKRSYFEDHCLVRFEFIP